MSNPEEQLISHDILSILYALLAAIGIAIYFSWGIMYGVWWDVGLYSVTAVMVGFGIVGFLLYSIKEE
ncbi:MAG: hypothetical protein ACOC89_03945 [Candidatus Saliniplasma sp.]